MIWDATRTNFDRSIAVVIGINDYKHGIAPLTTPVPDATKIADLLEKEYKYEKVIRLFDFDATKDRLKELLKDTLHGMKLTEADRLFFYFAGHGFSHTTSKDGPQGYLILQDSQQGKLETYLPMQELYDALHQLNCHHLLLVLDCCFAGNFKWTSTKNVIPSPEKIFKEHYDRFIRYPAWQVITSAAHNQEAADLSPVNRETDDNSQNSAFATSLIKGLQGEADLTQDKVIVPEELYLYLRDKLRNEEGDEFQIAGLWPFSPKKHGTGEYIFTTSDFDRKNLEDAPPVDEKNNPYRGLESFDEKHSRFFFGREELVQELSTQICKPKQPLTVVSGVSGSGKSSLVKAGLIPYLKNISKVFRWAILEPMRPTEYPFTALAKTILPIYITDFLEQDIVVNENNDSENVSVKAQLDKLNFIGKKLQERIKDLDDQISKINGSSGKVGDNKDEVQQLIQEREQVAIWLNTSWTIYEEKLLLVVQQFEELYNLCKDENSDNKESEEQKQLNQVVSFCLNQLSQSLKADPNRFIEIVKDWGKKYPALKLLLIIDQFEELITLSQNSQGDNQNSKPNESKQFLKLLEKTLDNNLPELHIVVTLRSDFEPRFLNSDVLKSYWTEARFPVRAMRSDELREAIVRPAAEKALFFESPKLVDKLINEVGQAPGALPLLSFTLSELYINLAEKWRKKETSDRVLRLDAGFDKQGGIAGYLTRKANQIYDELPNTNFGTKKDHQVTMCRVMLRMVTFEGGETLRRRVPLSELEYAHNAENKRVKKVLGSLTQARLIVTGQDMEGKPYVEPAHDALVVGWNKLQEWINQAQETLIIQQRLTPVANDWNTIKAKEKPLAIHRKIEAFLISRIQYWNRNKKQEKRNKIEAYDKFKFYLKRSSLICFKTSKRIFQVLWALSLLASTRDSKGSAQVSTEYLWDNDPRLEELNLLLDSAKNWLNQIEEIFVRQSLIQKTSNSARWGLIWKVVQGAIFILFVLTLRGCQQTEIGKINTSIESAEASLRANNDLDAIIQILRARKSLQSPLQLGGLLSKEELIQVKRTLHRVFYAVRERNQLEVNRGSVYDVAFSPNGKLLATVGEGDKVILWNVLGHQPKHIQEFNTRQEDIISVAFNPDGKLLATAADDGTVKLLKIKDNGTLDESSLDSVAKLITEKTKNETTQVHLAFSTNQKCGQLVTGEENGTLKLWKINQKSNTLEDSGATTIPTKIKERQQRIYSVAFSPNCKLIATVGEADKISIWNTEDDKPPYQFQTGQQDESKQPNVYSVAFTKDGELATGGADSGVLLWKIEQDGKVKFDQTSPRKSIETQQGNVYGMAISSSGRVATVGADDTVILWDMSGKQLSSPIQPSEESIPINSVAFSEISDSKSPDRKKQLLATGGADGTLKLWDAQSGKQLSRVQTNQYSIHSLAFNQKGDLLATGGADGTVKLWDAKGNEFKERRNLNIKMTKAVIAVAFNPYEKDELGIFAADGTFQLRNTKGDLLDQPYQTDVLKKQNVERAVFTKDGDLVTVDNRGKLWLWDNPKQPTLLLPEVKGRVNSVAIGSNGNQLVIGKKYGGVVELWENPDQPTRKFRSVREQQGSVEAIAISPDGKLVATVGEDGKVRLLDTHGNQPVEKETQLEEIPSLVFSHDDTKLAVLGKDGTLQLFTIADNTLEQSTQHNQIQKLENVSSVAFSRDGELIATGGTDGTVILWDKLGNKLDEKATNQSNVSSLAFSSDNQLLATININKDDNTFSLWTIREDRTLSRTPQGIVKGTVLSPDNKQLATVGEDGKTVIVQNSLKSEILKNIPTEQGGILSAAFGSRDGNLLLATAGKDGTVRLGDTSGAQFDQIQTLQGRVTNMVFSPDGTLLATLGNQNKNNTLRLWDISSKKIREFRMPLDGIDSVAFSHNGKFLAAGGENGTVQLWKLGGFNDLDPELLRKTCDWVRDYLYNNPNVEESDRKLCNNSTS